MKLRIGSKVSWRWAGGIIHGVVVEAHTETVVREIKGKLITRHGSRTKPAYLVRSQAGNLALKLASELTSPTQASGALRARRADVGWTEGDAGDRED